jgi:hypothetical protein
MQYIVYRVVILIFVLAISSDFAMAKKMYPININKGEMPNDVCSNCEVTLSEENCGEGAELSLKLAFSKPGWAGEYNPKRSNWIGYKWIKFNAFNPTDKSVKMAIGIKDEQSIGNSEARKTWIVIPFELKPGMNDVKLSLEGIKAQDGRTADLKRVKQWFFSYKFFPENSWEEKGGDEFTVFISNLRLESE